MIDYPICTLTDVGLTRSDFGTFTSSTPSL